MSGKLVYLWSLTVILGSSALLGACIKENRHNCPCILTVPIAGAQQSVAGREEAILSVAFGNFLLRDRFLLESCREGVRRMEVPRGECNLLVASGLEEERTLHDSLYVLPGSQWGKVMLASCFLDCNADELEAGPDYHKEYCTLNIALEGVPLNGETSLEFEVRASCSGVRMTDGSPIEGTYSSKAIATVFPAMFTVRLPRQNSSGIWLDVLKGDMVVDSLDLGEMLREESFSWAKNDLDDVFLRLDYSKMTVGLDIVPWNSNEMNVVI